MSTIVTRAAKGSPLTHAEVDANFTNLNTDKYQSGDSVTFTTLTANSTSEFGRSSANYWQAVGAATTLTPEFVTLGSDTNIPVTFRSKGTGAVNLAPGSRGVNISNGGTVTAITRTNTGSGYTSFPSIAISAPTTAGGVQATATIPFMFVTGGTIVSGGTGYTVNDILTVVGGTFPTVAGTLRVSSVSGGVITGLAGDNFANYSVLPTNPILMTGGTGTGASVNVTYGVSSTNFPNITNAGSGYVEQPTVTFSGGGGSGAAAYATVGSGTTVRSLGGQTEFLADNTTILHLRAKNTSGGNSTNATAVFGMIPPQSNFGAPMLGFISSPYFVWGGTGTAFFQSNATSPQTSGNSGSSQFAVAHTASAVNYVQVTGAATGVQPIISSQGSDANIGMTIRSKGTFACEFQSSAGTVLFQALPVASSVNFCRVAPAVAGSAPVLSSQGSDTNIDLALTTKGTGAVNLNTGGGVQFKVVNTNTAVNYFQANGGATGVQPGFSATGTDTNVSSAFTTKGTGAHFFSTNSFGQTQFVISHTASAVNYVQVTGGATTGSPNISFTGSDATVSGFISLKGSAAFSIFNGGGTSSRLFRINGSASSAFVNYPQVTPSTSGVAPSFNVDGSDTNIDLALTPKGTGLVRFGTRTATSDVAITGYLEIKDSGGTTRKLAIID